MADYIDAKKEMEDRKPLTDEQLTDVDQSVEAPLRDQIVEKLLKKLEDDEVPQMLTKIWHQAISDKAERHMRVRKYIEELDEFHDPIYDSATDWGSVLHLPTTLTITKTFHARFYSALLGTRPSFTAKARIAANAERSPTVQRLMEYNLREWANEHQGVEDSVDKWIWAWVSEGEGFLKSSWLRRFTQFEDVELVPVEERVSEIDPQTGEIITRSVERMQEVAVDKVEKVVDCPMGEHLDNEDVIVIGADGCPQRGEKVLERVRLKRGELYSLADQKVFDIDAVEELIQRGPTKRGASPGDAVKMTRKQVGGESQLDPDYEEDEYEILECYIRHVVNDSGIPSDVVVWIAPDLPKPLRATYLRRVTRTGLRPYARIEFYKRNGTNNPAGLPELLYSLSKEIDAIHNIRMDVGLLQSMPFGYYKPTATMTDEKMPVEPGVMFPLMDPSRDVFFPNIGNKVSFGFQEEASLISYVEKLTSINDMSLGVMSGAQGATRTATGARLLAGESTANLDIFLQRLNRGWKHFLRYQWGMIQDRLPDGFEFRLFGSTSLSDYIKIRDRRAIQGEFDFEIEPNSANSNPQLVLQQAQQKYQMTQNPIDIQLGLVTPSNRFEALKDLLTAMGVRDVSRFITEPDDFFIKLTPADILNRVIRGEDVPIDPRQDWQGFLALTQAIQADDELLGQFDQQHVVALVAKAQQAQQLLAAMQQAQNDAMVARQTQANTDATFGGGVTANINANQGEGVLGS